ASTATAGDSSARLPQGGRASPCRSLLPAKQTADQRCWCPLRTAIARCPWITSPPSLRRAAARSMSAKCRLVSVVYSNGGRLRLLREGRIEPSTRQEIPAVDARHRQAQ